MPAAADAAVQVGGNSIYRIHIHDANSGNSAAGTFTITTGSGHPLGQGKNVLFGSGSPGTSSTTVRSYGNTTDYVQDNAPSAAAGFTKSWLGSASPVVQTISGGFRTTYTAGDLIIVQDVRVVGTTIEDSRTLVETDVVNNHASDSASVGIRYLWDYQIGSDDGPTFQRINPDGPVEKTEAQFAPPGFETYKITDNDTNPSSPTYSVLGTAGGPPGLSPAPTPPNVLQAACWSGSRNTTFAYTPSGRNYSDLPASTTNCADMSVNYIWGDSSGNARTLAPNGGSTTVSASPVATNGSNTPLGNGEVGDDAAGGDDGHGGSPTPTQNRQICTNLNTKFVTCRDPEGVPGVCGPTGTIFPQCNFPVVLPQVCGPSNTLLVACTPRQNYITACGSFGTILPPCNLPPAQLPQVCGPSNTLLPPCTPSNNPVLVCGPSGTILPQCNFNQRINAPVIGLTNEPVQRRNTQQPKPPAIDVDLSCPVCVQACPSDPNPSGAGAKVPSGPRPRASTHIRPKEKKKKSGCDDMHAALGILKTSLLRTLDIHSARTGQQFYAEARKGGYEGLGGTNQRAWLNRSVAMSDGWLSDIGLRHPYDEPGTFELLRSVNASGMGYPWYIGPGEIHYLNPILRPQISFYARELGSAVDQYKQLANILRARRSRKVALPAQTGTPPGRRSIKRPALVKRIRIRGHRRTRVRLRLPRRVLRQLNSQARTLLGKRRRGTVRVPIRLMVTYRARFRGRRMPVVRVVDFPLRVKTSKPAKKRRGGKKRRSGKR